MFRVEEHYPFAAFVNAMIGYAQSPFMSLAAFASQARVGYDGDPLAGTVIRGASLKWNEATQVQQFINVWYGASGNNPPDDYDAVLTANAGPELPWNYSYAKWAELGILKLR